MMAVKNWPRLSETLTHARAPELCQSCGQRVMQHRGLERWLECDDQDRPTNTVVILCARCSKNIIEPHPRLYRQLLDGEPFPGVMPVCNGCRFTESLKCTCPAAKINGGEGLFFLPPPSRVHLNAGKRSGWYWLGPPIETCSGFQPKP
jgi:hypothetical protein